MSRGNMWAKVKVGEVTIEQTFESESVFFVTSMVTTVQTMCEEAKKLHEGMYDGDHKGEGTKEKI